MAAAQETIGLVLAGGGARGAYEAGALAVLLPELERRGQRPRVVLGTSVGAINAAFYAASAHLPASEAVAAWQQRWRSISPRRVLRPIAGRQVAVSAVQYAAELLGIPGADLHGLLDPAPLQATLQEWIDWPALHDNVARDRLDAVAVVATTAESERSVVFVEGRVREQMHASRTVEYVPAELSVTHVRASAAIPALFPAVRVETPHEARGWYFDGGTRLNTPIKPALDLGVDRVVVIATHAWRTPERSRGDAEHRPDVSDGALQLIQATLVDPLVNDLAMLGKVNLLLQDGSTGAAAAQYREALGKAPWHTVPYMVVAPRRRGAFGRLAREVFAEHFSGLRRLRSPDISLLQRLLASESDAGDELLSYLFFEPEFAGALIELGRQDAQAWIDDDQGEDGLWRTGPLFA